MLSPVGVPNMPLHAISTKNSKRVNASGADDEEVERFAADDAGAAGVTGNAATVVALGWM